MTRRFNSHARWLGFSATFALVASCAPTPQNDAGQDAAADTTQTDIASDTAVDSTTPDTSTDTSPPDVVADASADAETEASIDAGTDATVDAGTDATPDAATRAYVSTAPSYADCPGPLRAAVWAVLPDEAGHFGAERLTPPSYPYTVQRIAYDIIPTRASTGDAGTDDGGAAEVRFTANLAHQVQLYVSTATAPTAQPSMDGTLVRTIDVPARPDPTDPSVEFVAVELPISPPITLTAGQSLFVAVQYAASTDFTAEISLGQCSPLGVMPTDGGMIPGAVDHSYWSNAPSEPFNWADLVAVYGFQDNYTFRMYDTP
jgi:hypothetical protein